MRLRIVGVLLASVITPISVDAMSDPLPRLAAGPRPLVVAAKEDESDLPVSREALFASESDVDTGGVANSDAPPADAIEALFGLDPASENASAGVGPSSSLESTSAVSPGQGVHWRGAIAETQSPIHGYLQVELARTFANPEHWSKSLGRLEVGSSGRFGQKMRWHASGRVDYNAVYDLTGFYQDQVREDQRAEFQLRETYLDFSSGVWDWRLGRQHVVWGEMVGLFFADVVSAKDLREFVLPDFQVLRIPQWAARAEYFEDEFHAEVVWIPFPSYDRIGKPVDLTKPGAGSDFYPYPPSFAPAILNEDRPSTALNHTNFGVRLSQLSHGWDLSGFYYSSMNSAATYYRDPVTLNTFSPRHDRIWQLGGTLAKDLGDFVLKAEAVYTDGRRYNLVTDLTDADGVVKQNNLDWVVGMDFNPSTDVRINTQFFQRYFFQHNADIIPDKTENGASLFVSVDLPGNWKTEALLVHSLNRSDWMFRPKASWAFRQNWKWTFGADLFGGPPTGLFGQYDGDDRVYAEVRLDF